MTTPSEIRAKVKKWVRYAAYADTKKDQKISQSVGEILALIARRDAEHKERLLEAVDRELHSGNSNVISSYQLRAAIQAEFPEGEVKRGE